MDYTWTNASIQKFDFDWDTILYSDNKGKRDTVTARMFSFLGNMSLLNVDYDKGSEASAGSVATEISTLGGGSCIFRKLSMSENIDTIADFIINGRKVTIGTQRKVYKAAPLITFGIKENDTTNNHAWVIDGTVTRKRCMTDSTGKPIGLNPVYSKALPMWHCLWGWSNKKADGWYVYLKDTQKLDTIQYDPFSNKVNSEGLWPTG